MTSASPLSPAALLRWYIDAGADETVGEVALDRFALSSAPPAPRPSLSAAMAPEPARAASTPITGTATHIASGCATLAELRRALEDFESPSLRRAAQNTVFADGDPQAAVMVIGEAPGQQEDRQGLPFVGKSGKLLDSMLGSIGLDRSSVYITNVVAWRPLDNRKPTAEEVAVCLPFLVRHIELVDPQLLILLGGAAASAVLARHEGITRLRGQWHSYESPGMSRPVPAIATFHPAYLLRTPEAKRGAWRDLLAVKRRLEGMSASAN